jgi:ankyrin repeat protein
MRKADVNSEDSRTGDRPLHLLVGVYNKNPIAAQKIFNFLVQAGADPNVKNNEQWSPFHLAIKKGFLDIVEAFLAVKNQTFLDIDAPGGYLNLAPLHICT